MKKLNAVAWWMLLVLGGAPVDGRCEARFADDFETDLRGWELIGAHSIHIVDSGDPTHGRVLELVPDGSVFALIKDSDQWGNLSIEGEMLFPDDADNYLGIIYNYTRSVSRTDFGSVYVKGGDSYIRVNPWRDGNVSRLLYEEFKTPLVGDDAVHIGRWHPFRAEIVANAIHLYVGDPSVPKLTFDLYEHRSGLAGFGPRIAGFPVWVDNVSVSSIGGFSYVGPPIPDIIYELDSLLTDWQVIGPLDRPNVEIERATGGRDERIATENGAFSWRSFEPDARGAVITGRVTEYDGARPVAYFRTLVNSRMQRDAVLHLSTVDELGVFVNGRFLGFCYRDGYISGENDWNSWYDFWKNPSHAGRKLAIPLEPGTNQIVLRVRNGHFASGGFFARLE
jgi:hypothetical protein